MKSVTRTNLFLMCAGFVIGAIGAVLWFREPMEPLTREGLAAARQRWRAAAVRAYEVRYRMHGSEYVIHGRDGIVEEASVNGRPPTTSNLNVYSIDGLFDTLEQELENSTDPAGPFAGRAETVLMRVRFNRELGYLERYLRSSGGQGRGASIEMIEFSRRE
jgi:hypothetical protein